MSSKPPRIRHILCPVDFSEPSEHALRHAIELAARLDADVHLLHAYQQPIYTLPDGAMLAPLGSLPDLGERVDEELAALAERYADRGVELLRHSVEDVPHRGIDATVSNQDIDLVVMGTHGRTGLTHFMLGSVAEKVVRTSDVPVLTVRGRSD